MCFRGEVHGVRQPVIGSTSSSSSTHPQTDPARSINPDHELIREFLAQGGAPRAFDANPLARTLRTQIIAAEQAAGSVTLAFEPGAEFLQGTGVIQGGIIASMLDFALAFAVFTKLGPDRSHATVSLSVSFLSPARSGRYRAVGRVERLGGRLAFASATLAREDKAAEPVATASGAMAIIAPNERKAP
jgi:uncharacterized protein (TIGR00369 family)